MSLVIFARAFKQFFSVFFPYGASPLKPRLHQRFFACDGDTIFLKIVASPARGENRMCSHPRTGDATDEKIAEKNREKFNELNFLRQNHGLRQRVATRVIFAVRWRRDNFIFACAFKQFFSVFFPYGASPLKPRLHERFFACDGDTIFLKIVASPARSENRMCSHPRTGDATDEKIAEKNRKKFNELNFLRQNHGHHQRVATRVIFAVCWRRDNFKKIASPSQAKNRLAAAA